jgi:hypothetical protein
MIMNVIMRYEVYNDYILYKGSDWEAVLYIIIIIIIIIMSIFYKSISYYLRISYNNYNKLIDYWMNCGFFLNASLLTPNVLM